MTLFSVAIKEVKPCNKELVESKRHPLDALMHL